VQSCLENLSEIVSSLNQMLPQLTGFIEQFHNAVKEFDVNVITDSFGNMSVDVPADMSDIQAQNVSKRLGIIDKLINSHGTSINDLFQKGINIENKLRVNNSNYSSILTEKIAEFKALNSSYKH
jgi:DNA repair ATPase RecN